ncbi:predicted protein [Nematostella vectensis]|uniref:BHLH domain-containing protein n=1 Tax=Nematostella vectensis TaxID=45351 RepID=A7RIL0_NEMVE|nr:uncharacterized protein LOC5521076 [Nematostella vectensis]EDO48730.1 predicted protein [Nematostella vectensis]|eukprot:XP_001640793.1 predicted protein [Nematostella vectensis]
MFSPPFSPLFRRRSVTVFFDDLLSESERQSGDNITNNELLPVGYERDRRPSLRNNWNSNLQVVPGISILDETAESVFINDNESQCSKMSNTNAYWDNYIPRSPFLTRTSISELDGIGVLSPLYSVSTPSNFHFTKSPSIFEICSASRRKSSEDLSIYLPDHFTPLTLEGLENAVTKTVFQFPVIKKECDELANDNDVFTNTSENDLTLGALSKDNDVIPGALSGDVHSLETKNDCIDSFAKTKETIVKNDEDIGIKQKNPEECQKKRRKRRNLVSPEAEVNAKRSQEKKSVSLSAQIEPDLRNQLERERRNDLNTKFQKLKSCLPAMANCKKASKIAILREATNFTTFLRKQEVDLEKEIQTQKALNTLLLQKLVDVNAVARS